MVGGEELVKTEIIKRLVNITFLTGENLTGALKESNERLIESFEGGVNYEDAIETALVLIATNATHLENKSNQVGQDTEQGAIYIEAVLEGRWAIRDAGENRFEPIKQLLLDIAESSVETENVGEDSDSLIRKRMRALNNLAASLPAS